MLLALAVLLEDVVFVLVALVATGTGIALEIFLGAAAIHGISSLF